jgi:hypothetical protein
MLLQLLVDGQLDEFSGSLVRAVVMLLATVNQL